MPTVTEIEQAIAERISTELPYVRTLGSMAEFLAKDLAVLDETALLCPAVFVIYGRGKYSQKISGCRDREMIFALVAVVRNLRGDAAARHGAAGEKGIYGVLEDLRAALSGHSCGIDIDPLEPLYEEAVTGSRDLAVYEILFKTRCRFAG